MELFDRSSRSTLKSSNPTICHTSLKLNRELLQRILVDLESPKTNLDDMTSKRHSLAFLKKILRQRHIRLTCAS